MSFLSPSQPILCFSRDVVPCVLFEDEHLLVVNKPAGLNTHAPSPYAGEGIYDWLRNREPRWATLAIIHRLDKETSGVMVFSKTPLANRSLTEQFSQRVIRKTYILVTDRHVSRKDFVVRGSSVRIGDRYASRPSRQGGEYAETRFRRVDAATFQPTLPLASSALSGNTLTVLLAEPKTGRTHQIRVHAAENGFPVLGDTLYGGASAPRVFLHAAEITFRHPASGEQVTYSAPPNFDRDARLRLREALIDATEHTCWRMAHGAADGRPDWYVDKLGDYLLAQTEAPLSKDRVSLLRGLARVTSARGAYHKRLDRQVRRSAPTAVSPRLVLGEPATGPFKVRENGLTFELSFGEGFSVGLFLDQRENRRRLLTGHLGAAFALRDRRSPSCDRPLEVLNTFAYTCAFSVCSARAGAHVTSLDLSPKYLEWGRRNFLLNELDPSRHDFIFGDAFDWLHRLRRKARRFGLILLDPPTFSTSKDHGCFRADGDYGSLVTAALPLLESEGILFASTNAAGLPPEEFLGTVQDAIRKGGRKVLQQHYAPQPPDFPGARAEPAYLKTVWLRIQ